MSEWLYKATPTMVPFEPTRRLAVDDGFLCRSAYKTNGARVANTQHVEFGDLLHMYFAEHGRATIIGTFEVVGPNEHPHGTVFGPCVNGTTLFAVADANFAKRLRGINGTNGEGYGPDPVVKQFTGWALISRLDVKTPAYAGAFFPGMVTLARRNALAMAR